MSQTTAWIGFHVLIIFLLLLDLLVLHRKAHAVSLREALGWSAFWIGLALVFNLGIYFWEGPELALQFLTGYLLEKSLSVDNLFVFLLIFGFFRVPDALQHRVLFWGILGALLMRALFIFGGLALIERFEFMTFLLGGLLVYGGVRMFFKSDESGFDPGKNVLLRMVRRVLPVLRSYHGDQFVVRRGRVWYATPLLLTLISIEFSDVVFALDSIPAILAISRDPFIVYTSNIFALLGLRSLYFALAGLMDRFYLLHYGLGFILAFVGVKLLLSEWFHIGPAITLAVIGLTLSLAIGWSLLRPRPVAPEAKAEPVPTQEPVSPSEA